MRLKIDIHAFPLSEHMGAVFADLQSNKRGICSTITITDGGMERALPTLSDVSTPPLVIVESASRSAELLQELDALANVCQPGTHLILIGAENDIHLYRTLIKQGVDQYLLNDVSGNDLRAAIVEIFSETGRQTQCRTIAFYGVRGGVGSSAMAHNVAAWLAAVHEKPVLLMDLDIPTGTAALSFNLQPRHTIVDALAHGGMLEEGLFSRYLENAGPNISVLCAPGQLNASAGIQGPGLEEIITVGKKLADYVVLDIPHVWESWVPDTLIDADETVLVANPDLYNLRDGKNLIEYLAPQRPVDAPLRLVLNKVGLNGKGELGVADFKEVVGLSPAGTIAFDGNAFQAAMNNGEMLETVARKSNASLGMESLAMRISGLEEHPGGGKSKSGGLWASLFTRSTD